MNTRSSKFSLIPTPQRISALEERPLVISFNLCSSDMISGWSFDVWMRISTWVNDFFSQGSCLITSPTMLSILFLRDRIEAALCNEGLLIQVFQVLHHHGYKLRSMSHLPDDFINLRLNASLTKTADFVEQAYTFRIHFVFFISSGIHRDLYILKGQYPLSHSVAWHRR